MDDWLARQRTVVNALAGNPTMDFPYAGWMPEEPTRYFYTLRDSLMFANDQAVPSSPMTLAIGDIENNSIFADETYDLNQFTAGLLTFFP